MALESGMVTLLGYSLELVRQGHTTLEEVGRMILTDSGLESERRARALSTMTCEGCGAGLQEGWLECPYCLTERHLGPGREFHDRRVDGTTGERGRQRPPPRHWTTALWPVQR